MDEKQPEKDQLDRLLEAANAEAEDQLTAAEAQALENAGEASQPQEPSEDEKTFLAKMVEAISADEEEDNVGKWSVTSVLRGRLINAGWFRRNALLILLILALTIVYVSNRYASQQEIIQIDELKKELVDKRYDALTRSSQLMQKCRQSQILEILRHTSDSTLQVSKEPPFEINMSTP